MEKDLLKEMEKFADSPAEMELYIKTLNTPQRKINEALQAKPLEIRSFKLQCMSCRKVFITSKFIRVYFCQACRRIKKARSSFFSGAIFQLEPPDDREGKLGGNWWLNQTQPKIPLGKVSRSYDFDWRRWYKIDPATSNVAWMMFPYHKGKHISDSILIAGITGTGKSVCKKLVQHMIAQARPVIDFDWKGSDSYLMAYPNSQPFNLPPQIKAEGLQGNFLYYPTAGARPKRPHERVVRPNLTKYNNSQLQALGFSPGAAKYFRTIIRRYGPFKSLESLYQFIEFFPKDEGQSRMIRAQIQKGKLKLKHTKIYKSNDTINQNSKESIKKVLPGLMEKNIFRLDNKEEFNFTNAFLKGNNIFFSFNDKEVGRVEINYYMKRIEIIRNQYPQCPRYFVFIEEAHKVLAKQAKLPGQAGDSISEVIEDFILTCRKISVGLCLVMPEVIGLSDRVLYDIKNIICSKFKGENARILTKTMYDRRAQVIPYLRYNRFRNEREFLYYNQDFNHFSIFVPFNSPNEIHRE